MEGTRGKGSLKRNLQLYVRAVFRGVTTTNRTCWKGKIAAAPFSQDEESLKEAELVKMMAEGPPPARRRSTPVLRVTAEERVK